MAHVTVPATRALVEIPVGSTPTTGPFNVPAWFIVFEKANLRVFIGASEIALSGFTFTGSVAIPGGFAGGTLNLSVAVASTTVRIFREMEPGRSIDFPEGAPVPRPVLNTEFDRIAAQLVDLRWRLENTVRLPDVDLRTDALPDALSRANKAIIFDTNGLLTVGDFPSAPAATAEQVRDPSFAGGYLTPATAWPIVKPNPKTLVILGSSNAAGWGASTFAGDPSAPLWREPPTSWAGRIRTVLEADGWTVINRSISGTATATGLNNSVDRFLTDVAIYRPSHIIFATGPHNDGYNARAFLNGTRRLIQLARGIGAVPIVRGPSPWNSVNATQWQAMKDIKFGLDQLGVWQIDALNPVVDWNWGSFADASYHTDGLHLTDLGYEICFDAIDMGMFTGGEFGPQQHKPNGTWFIPSGSTATNPMFTDADRGLRAMKDWSIGARIKNIPSNGPAAAFLAVFLHGIANAALRVRDPVYAFGVTQGDGLAGVPSNVAANDRQGHYHLVTYRRRLNVCAYYIDGVLIGTFNPAGLGGVFDVLRVAWGGQATTTPAHQFEFSECLLWRTAIAPWEAMALARNGRFPTAGLIVDVDMSGNPPPVGGHAMNLVQSGTHVMMNEQWAANVPAKDLRSPVVLFSGPVGTGAATTAEEVLANIAIPPGALSNTGAIRIAATFIYSNTANNKTLRVRLGGLSGTAYVSTVRSGAGEAAYLVTRTIFLNNAQNAQISNVGAGDSGAEGIVTASLVTSTVDLTAPQFLTFTGQKANAGDALSLSTLLVELIP